MYSLNLIFKKQTSHIGLPRNSHRVPLELINLLLWYKYQINSID